MLDAKDWDIARWISNPAWRAAELEGSTGQHIKRRRFLGHTRNQTRRH
jgi:hypothetical protein